MGITLKYIKPLFYWMPELYLVLATLLYWVSTATLLNPVAFVLLILLTSQLVFNKKGLGLFLGSVLVLLNLYLFLALFSDIVASPSFTISVQKFLLVGGIFLVLNLIMAVKLLLKHIDLHPQSNKILG
ncbi:hypothetical protein DDV96_12650 [Marixanthomonas spongiae]|uniref:Uncharacterized protein n=2 Tax=Marixanthomonas spongiae TaxID=2174845 RepID=A0A2U0HXA5_9FLAO|nr:hypothetical protein DDV96_12650 [Marixanthomonas spongiae]